MNKDRTGLIIIDIQGKLARLVDNSEAFIRNCASLIQGAQILGLPILWLEQNPEKIGATVEELSKLLPNQSPIIKYTFSACKDPAFIDAIKQAGIKNWLICGIEAHICVYQTARDLKELGFQVQLLTDCVSSRTAENKQLAIKKLADLGIELSSLEMALFELMKDCRSPEFKHILQFIK